MKSTLFKPINFLIRCCLMMCMVMLSFNLIAQCGTAAEPDPTCIADILANAEDAVPCDEPNYCIKGPETCSTWKCHSVIVDVCEPPAELPCSDPFLGATLYQGCGGSSTANLIVMTFDGTGWSCMDVADGVLDLGMPPIGSMVNVIVCSTSNNLSTGDSGLTYQCPCDFEATCLLSPDVQVVEGCTMADAPAPYTDFNDVFTAVNICGAPIFTVLDSGTGDLCGAVPLQMTRMYTLGDDLDGSGAIDNGEPFLTCNEVYVIENTTPPAITCPADASVTCFAGVFSGTPTATTNCGEAATVTIGDITPNDPCADSWTITYTATDACGISADCTQTFTKVDGPTISCDHLPTISACAPLSPGGFAVVTDPCATDPVAVVTNLVVVGPINCSGATHTYTHSYTNDCGVTISCDQVITVDGGPPSITCPADAVVNCIGDVMAGTPIVTTTCNVGYDVVISDPIPAGTGGSDCIGDFLITYTVTDICGGTASCTQTLTLNSLIDIDCSALPTTSACAPTGPGGVAVVNDPCAANAVAIVTGPDIAGTPNCPGTTYTYTHTYTADCGQTIACHQVITVDGGALTITCPSDTDVTCYDDIQPALGDVVVTSSCDQGSTVTTNGPFPVSSIATGCPDDQYFITYTVTDDCGKTASCTQTFTIANAPPVIMCPANITVTCEADVVPGLATATLACGEDPVIVTDVVITGTAGCDGAVYEFINGVTDACGRFASCTQTITIENAPPTITCPAHVTVECLADVMPGVPTATLACGQLPAIETVGPILISGTAECNNAIYEFTYSVTDACDRTASCLQQFTLDHAPLSITCPADLHVVCDAVDFDAIDAWLLSPDVHDVCDLGYTLTNDFNPELLELSCPNGSNMIGPITFTATNFCGESTSCEAYMIWVDDEAPVINCPASLTLSCDQIGEPTGDISVTDNCTPDDLIVVTFTTASTFLGDGCGQYSFVITNTWTATDLCGNESEPCVQFVEYSDFTPPVITCPADANLNCTQATDPGALGYATATDNCAADDEIVITHSDASTQTTDGCGQYTYVITRTWTAEDPCGNVASCGQTIHVSDEEAPIIECPASIEINCTASTHPDNTGYAIATDNCAPGSEINITWDDDSTQGTSGCAQYEYVITRTWTATDPCGNYNACVQTIHVVDDNGLVIVCPANITISCDASTAPGNTGYATATDDCADEDEIVITQTESSTQTDYGCGQYEYTITRIWKAEDPCGNEASCHQTIEVADNEAPEIYCPDDLTISCDADRFPPATGVATATDNCAHVDEISIEALDNNGNLNLCNNTGFILRTWFATDPCGNTSSCVQRIDIFDDEAPVITVGATSIVVECGPANTTQFNDWLNSNVYNISGTDNCGEPTLEYDADPNFSQECGNAGLYIIQFKLVDDCGNYTPTIGVFEVEDTTEPYFDFVPADETIDCCDQVNFGTPVAYDVCGGVVLTSSDETNMSGDCPNEYSVTRTWYAYDDCGNSAGPVSQTIHVEDNTAPVMEANHPLLIGLESGETLVLDCSNTEVFTADDFFIGDCCDPNASIMMMDDLIFQGSCNDEGVRTRMYCIWIGKDACGNTTEFELYLDYVDTTAPMWVTFPDDVTVECDDNNYDYEAPTGNDDCGGDLVLVTYNDVTTSTDCIANGGLLVTRTYTIEDECGNSATRNQLITFVDNDGPVFSNVPAYQTLECGEDAVWGTPSATDECGTVVSIDSYDTEGTDGCEGSITRTWVATDDCGNTSNVSATVSFEDTVDPVFTDIPSDQTIGCNEEVVFGHPLCTDECDTSLTHSQSDSESGNACNKTYTRTWTATDNCGNSTSVSQSITMVDDEAPVISSIPENIEIQCGQGTVFDTPTATDNCGSPTLTSVDETLFEGCATGFAIHRTWTATDECGNTSTTSQTAHFIDDANPYFTNVPDDVDAGCGSAGFGSPTANDDCDDNVTVTHADTESAVGCTLTRTRTWTATDACGNSASVSQSITSSDDGQAPVISNVGDDMTMTCGNTANFSNPNVVDDCTETTLTFEDHTSHDGCHSSTTRTWTATDGCGNTATASQTITSSDDGHGPAFSNVGGDINVNCGETASFSNPTVADDCSEFTLTHADNTSTDGCYTTSTRTWTATDACGNTSSASQSITSFEDNQAPSLGEIASDFVAECNEDPAWETPTVSDNCSAEVTLTYADTNNGGDCASGYDITRIWTATDGCGNTATTAQTVWIYPTGGENTIAFSYIPPDQTIYCNDDMAFGTPIGTSSCEDFNMTYEDTTDEDDCGNYSVTRKWTATDDCTGNATCEQTIHVVDNVPPYFTFVPADSEIVCGQEVTFGAPTCEDECGHVSDVSWEDNIVEMCGNSYSITRTWTVADNCGNINTSSQKIEVLDTEAPTFANTLVDKNVSCNDAFEFDTPTATENCNGEFNLTFEDDVANNDCAVNYAVTRTWTATDACGNIANISQTITRPADLEAPVFNNLPENMEVACDANVEFSTVDATDNCALAMLSFTDETVEGNCAGAYSIERTWTATDDCGNTTSATRSISFSDNVAPIFTSTPSNMVIDCNTTPTFGTPTVEDNCGAANVTFEDVTSAGDCATGYTITRTWTAIDACGNEVTTAQTITVDQDTEVSFSNVPASQTLSCGDTGEFGTPEVNSNCSEDAVITFEDEMIEGSCAAAYSIQRTWTANACGVEVSASATITYVDDQLPTFDMIPDNKTIDCSETPAFDTPLFSDNCSDVTMTHTDATATDNCEVVTTRTWTISDACGNVATAAQTITSTDNIAPEFTMTPSDFAIDCNTTPTFGTPELIDNCTNIELSFSDVTSAGDCSTGYTITRTWTGVDACGNAVTTSQTITVQQDVETTVAFSSVPADQTISCEDVLEFGTPEINSNCSDEVEITFVDQTIEGTCDATFAIQRTWTAEACDISVTASATITIEDNNTPSFDYVGLDKVVDCGESMEFDTPLFSDACSEVSISHTDATNADNCEVGYSITRTWTITDACGNAEVASQTITSIDTDAPSFDMLGEDKTISCAESMEFDTPLFSDACTDVSVAHADVTNSDNCAIGHSVTRTWTISDACGNTATASQTITSVDDVAPDFDTVPADKFVSCNDVMEFDMPAYSDACSDVSISHEDETNDSCETGFEITRTWTIVDACGNATSTAQTITREADTEAPLFAELPLGGSIDCAQNFEFGEPTVSDNCSDISISYVDNTDEGSCEIGYSFTRTWTAADACGNTTTASQTFTVENDNEGPEFTYVPEHVELQCVFEPIFGDAIAVDACSNVALTFEDETVITSCDVAEVHTRTWTATDLCGNTTTASQIITVVPDDQAPVFLSVPQDETINCITEINNEFGVPEVADNCGNIDLNFTDETVMLNCGYQVTRTWMATDPCGNTTSASKTLTLEDTEAPAATFIPADKTLTCTDEMEMIDAFFSDNCDTNFEVAFNETTQQVTCGYIVTRTWTASDQCANATTVSQTITVEDNEAPAFDQLPSDIEMTYDDFFAWEAPTLSVSDNCSNATVTDVVIISNENCEDHKYFVTWTATDDCGNAAEHTMTIPILDDIMELALDAPTEIMYGGNEVITANVNYGLAPYTFDWSVIAGNDWTIDATENIANLTAGLEEATVEVKVTDAMGCTNTTTIVVIGNHDEDISRYFEIVPNPTYDDLLINFSSEFDSRSLVNIYDVLGRKIHSNRYDVISGHNQHRISVEHFAEATYFITVEVGDRFYTQKFLKLNK